MIVHELPRGRIHVGDWLEADLEPGYDLSIVDGPYAIGVAEWDRMKPAELAAWYEPHLERVTALSAKSASVYLWNMHGGLIELDPIMRRLGWTRRAVITWDKVTHQAMKGIEDMRTWLDVTEVCGFYQREAWASSAGAAAAVAYAAGADERNWIREWLAEEWTAAGLRRRQADEALGTNGMAGHYFGASQWALPTWEAYQRLAAYASEHGQPRERPYFVHPEAWSAGGLSESYEHLRAEYEASRPAFYPTAGLTNVWSHPVLTTAERLIAPGGGALHPCQKPLLFAERMIRSSTHPGGRVLEPFGGTCRAAVITEWMARTEPAAARRYDVCELNQDEGRDYVGAVLAQIRGEDVRPRSRAQIGLFAS